jgi:DNA-binding LacI/PurR family transcriptional regulator
VVHSEASDGASSLTNLAFFVRMLGSITENAVAQGFSTLLTLPPKAYKTGRFDVDGVIFVDPAPGNRLLEALRDSGIPIVTTGRDLSRPEHEGNWVDNDLITATADMLDLFAARGAERIALFAASPQISYNHDAIFSYRAVGPSATTGRKYFTGSATPCAKPKGSSLEDRSLPALIGLTPSTAPLIVTLRVF